MLSPTVFISYKNLYIWERMVCHERFIRINMNYIDIWTFRGDFLYHLISDKTTYFYLQKSAKKRMMYS